MSKTGGIDAACEFSARMLRNFEPPPSTKT